MTLQPEVRLVLCRLRHVLGNSLLRLDAVTHHRSTPEHFLRELWDDLADAQTMLLTAMQEEDEC